MHFWFIKDSHVRFPLQLLLFADTDSLTYEIEAEYVYKEFWNDMDRFYNSGYSKNSAYFDPTNKKVIGKFKDEAASMPIKEW